MLEHDNNLQRMLVIGYICAITIILASIGLISFLLLG
jgi:hypothetical protein